MKSVHLVDIQQTKLMFKSLHTDIFVVSVPLLNLSFQNFTVFSNPYDVH